MEHCKCLCGELWTIETPIGYFVVEKVYDSKNKAVFKLIDDKHKCLFQSYFITSVFERVDDLLISKMKEISDFLAIRNNK